MRCHRELGPALDTNNVWLDNQRHLKICSQHYDTQEANLTVFRIEIV